MKLLLIPLLACQVSAFTTPVVVQPLRSQVVVKHHQHVVNKHHVSNTILRAKDQDMQMSEREAKSSARPYFSAALFGLMDITLRQIFFKANIVFPHSLAGCGLLLATFFLAGKKYAKKMLNSLEDGADLLAAWMPVFFIPSLITLPLTSSISSGADLFQVSLTVAGGFLFTLYTTAWAVIATRKSKNNKLEQNVNKAKDNVKDFAQDVGDSLTKNADDESSPTDNNPVKPFSARTVKFLLLSSAITGAITFITKNPLSGHTATAYFLTTTLASYVFAARLPRKFNKIVHPLVSSTAFMWGIMGLLAKVRDTSFKSVLGNYWTKDLSSPAAGDLLLYCLGPAVISFAVAIYNRRKLVQENGQEIAASVSVSTIGGLFGTALIVRALKMNSPLVRLSLLSRNITSPLALAISTLLGADPSLAVAMVVVTGLIGANFGPALLDAANIKDPVPRGMAMGAAAHGLGTAAMSNEKDSFPFAALSMALTASAATVAVSIPPIRKAVMKVAIGKAGGLF